MSNELLLKKTLQLENIVKAIDKVFGEGYAKKHPELVAAFLIAESNVIAAAHKIID